MSLIKLFLAGNVLEGFFPDQERKTPVVFPAREKEYYQGHPRIPAGDREHSLSFLAVYYYPGFSQQKEGSPSVLTNMRTLCGTTIEYDY
jgi:hypothetical protein